MIPALVLSVILAGALPGCAPVVVPEGPKARLPELTGDRYVAADGMALPLAVWPAAKGPPKAVILGLHGFGDYRDAFEEPSAIWSKAGFTTYAYDQRGFGASPTRGRWPGTDTLVEDARNMVMLLREKYPGIPLYIAGESMGGAVAIVAADRGVEPDGLILLAPALRSRETFGVLFSGGLWMLGHLVPWLPAGPTSIDYHPTDDPKMLEKLRKDPLMLRQPRLDMGYGLVDLMDDACAALPRIHVPYIMLHGLGDKIVPEGPVREAIKVMPRRPDSKLAFYKNGFHLLLRDKEGPTVSADIVAWIDDHQASLPSGADSGQVKPEIAASWGRDRVSPR
ncbi:MAG TPA: alpha/beta hydrolase [Reyranella sp.]|jgi:alpha-beta hydrolase superfamily lysophospholipase|nr:alpha/beta hydrolase [Reyranella sp.]